LQIFESKSCVPATRAERQPMEVRLLAAFDGMSTRIDALASSKGNARHMPGMKQQMAM
jgi:hypothetical protein